MSSKVKILIVRETTPEKFIKAYNKAAKRAGVELDFATWGQVIIDTGASQSVNQLLVNGSKVTDYDIIYIRTIKSRYYEMAELVNFATHHGIRIVDKALSVGNRISDAKIHQILMASLAGIKVPRTVYATDATLVAEGEKFGTWPIILKVMGLHRGQGVFLVQNKAEIRKIMDRFINEHTSKNFVLQEVVDYTKDYRIFVVGNKVLGAIQRVPKTGEFRANVSRGGTAKTISRLPAKLSSLAVKAAKTMNLDIAGVDFMEDSQGNYYLTEINRSPQYTGLMEATGINVRYEIVKYLKELAVKIKA